MRFLFAAAIPALLAAASFAQQTPTRPPETIEITIAQDLRRAPGDAGFDGPFSGRLVVYLGPADARIARTPAGPYRESESKAQRDAAMRSMIAGSMFEQASRKPTPGYAVAAMDIANVKPGDTIRFDPDAIASPKGFSSFPPGDYTARAVLDVDNNLAYTGWPQSGDLVSPIVRITLGANARSGGRLVLGDAKPRLELVGQIRKPGPWSGVNDLNPPNADRIAMRERTHNLDFVSPSLSAFHGKETRIRGWVMLPPGYEQSSETFPAVYRFEGFGATPKVYPVPVTIPTYWPMYGVGGGGPRTPPMIWVLLDHSGPTGTHEFADSANNGPWGKALTEELIPWLETQYRMDARPSGRLLTGHSSGGWAALWLQVNYPKIFGGAWATSPDPADFRDFTNTDIYTPDANVFHAADGAEKPLVREGGKTTSFKAFSSHERVTGPVGGQLASFEWVFSPKGPDGKPRPLFDRASGKVDPAVAQYWGEHYDIARIIRRNWTQLKPDLDGKIHVTVGTADTYYLDQPARLLKQTLDDLGARSEFVFIEGADHSLAGGTSPATATNVDEANAIAMYRIVRPYSTFTPAPRQVRLTSPAPPQ